MESNTNSYELLIERTTDYAKTSFELGKLKAVDKASDIVSSLVPHSIVFIILATFIIFMNLGIAFWLGNILGQVYFGFFVAAGFYLILGLIIHFFMHKRIKTSICNYIITQLIKKMPNASNN